MAGSRIAGADCDGDGDRHAALAKCVLLDIEGTVCAVSFVRQTLVPYAQTALAATLERDWHSPEFAPYRQAFPQHANTSPQALRRHVDELVARDAKDPHLKALQGYLWRTGYQSGELAAPLYDDVPVAMERWTRSGATIAVFSSGSVDAQKLFFGHVRPLCEDGTEADADAPSRDLTGSIGHWFDTVNAGPKNRASSYTAIARAMGLETSCILFLSDNVFEVLAAREAGMFAIVIQRPGNEPIDPKHLDGVRVVSTFEGLDISDMALG